MRKKVGENFVLRAAALGLEFQSELIWKREAGGGSGIFSEFLRDHNILV